MIEHSVVYVISKNYCLQYDQCDNCKLKGVSMKRFKFYLCKLKTQAPIDNLISYKIRQIDGIHPLWKSIMKNCNDHYVYGRVGCCNGCKFYIEQQCVFNGIWENIR